MSVRQPWFGAGLLLYVTSFFLVATGATSPGGRLMGFECAYFAVDLPLTDTPFRPDSTFNHRPFVYFPVLVSGLINPGFLAYATIAGLNPRPRVQRVLRLALISMIPFCWVVFHFFKVYPREGHVLFPHL
jgi:hypothetical protein